MIEEQSAIGDPIIWVADAAGHADFNFIQPATGLG